MIDIQLTSTVEIVSKRECCKAMDFYVTNLYLAAALVCPGCRPIRYEQCDTWARVYFRPNLAITADYEAGLERRCLVDARTFAECIDIPRERTSTAGEDER